MGALRSYGPFICFALLVGVACDSSEAEPVAPSAPEPQAETAEDDDQADTRTNAITAADSSSRNDSPASGEMQSRAGLSSVPVIANDPDKYDWLEYQTDPDGLYGFRSVLVAFAETDNIDYDMMGLEYICDANVGLWVLVAAYPSYDGAQRSIAAPLNLDLGFPASAVFTGSTSGRDRYLEFDVLDETFAQYSNGVEFMSTSKAYESVTIRLPFAESYITAEIDLRGVFNTPIQPNLDRCGAY